MFRNWDSANTKQNCMHIILASLQTHARASSNKNTRLEIQLVKIAHIFADFGNQPPQLMMDSANLHRNLQTCPGVLHLQGPGP
jgi:hypothetical protein